MFVLDSSAYVSSLDTESTSGPSASTHAATSAAPTRHNVILSMTTSAPEPRIEAGAAGGQGWQTVPRSGGQGFAGRELGAVGAGLHGRQREAEAGGDLGLGEAVGVAHAEDRAVLGAEAIDARHGAGTQLAVGEDVVSALRGRR